METYLFPDQNIEDYVLDIKYDGPSFDGMMEISALSNEIAGFEICIKSVISVLRRQKGLDLNEDDFQIVVEAFENNCFRKKIKFIGKHLNKYPVAYLSIAGILGSIINIVPQIGADKIKEMSPATMAIIADVAKVELLKDPKFLNALAKTVKPLITDKDKVEFSQPVKTPNRTSTVKYSQKNDFLKLTSETEDIMETVAPGEVYGRVVSIDIDANKNQIDFKSNGTGERIRCTLNDGKRIDDYVTLLGKWAVISGDVKSANGQRIHILVKDIKHVPERRQEELGF
jgi:hypothetical protein